MASLKTNFAEGDVLWALNTTSTSGVNGITAAVNSKLVFVGSAPASKKMAVTYEPSGIEVTIASHIITALTVTSGIIATAAVTFSNVGAATVATYKLKLNRLGTIDTIDTITLGDTTDTTSTLTGVLSGYYNTYNVLSNSTVVFVTASNTVGDSQTVNTCRDLTIIGHSGT